MSHFRQTAEQIGCDALVTGSPALLGGMPERIVDRRNPMTATDACWLISLYLRSKDDYTWEIGDHHGARVDRWIFFYGMTRELLPDSWRWFSGAAYHKPASPRGDPVGLAMSGIERFDRALRARDRLHVMRQQGGGVNETDEEMFAWT